MAGIFKGIQSDIDKLEELKKKITDVKKELKDINIDVNFNLKEGLEEQLGQLLAQYNQLSQKIADAQAKVNQSAKKMSDATQKVTGDTKSNDSAEQKKAYQDLTDEVNNLLGTRERLVRTIVEEQAAIKIIKEEIKSINKDIEENGGATKVQNDRLAQLTDSLYKHKAALSDAQNTMMNYSKLNSAAETSMKALSLELGKMRKAYRQLTSEQRESPFGQEMLSQIQALDAEIKELDASVGNHQRNVGNYQSAFNGLDMSIKQVVRELPSAATGLNTFFLAISNNIPILVDEIKKASEANKDLIEKGEKGVPVWKQLGKSLFSFNSIMMIALTAFAMFGDKIMETIGNVLDGGKKLREEQEKIKKQTEELHHSFRNNFSSDAAKLIADYKRLQQEFAKLTNSAEKSLFLDKYHTQIKNLGLEINNLTDAEKVFNSQTNSVIRSFEARAKAAAAMGLTQKIWEDYYKKESTIYFKDNWAKEGLNPMDYKPGDEVKGAGSLPDYIRNLMGVGTRTRYIGTKNTSTIIDETYYTATKEALKEWLIWEKQNTHKRMEDERKKLASQRDKLIEKYQKEYEQAISKVDTSLVNTEQGMKNDEYLKELADRNAKRKDIEIKYTEEVTSFRINLLKKTREIEASILDESLSSDLKRIQQERDEKLAELDKMITELAKKRMEADKQAWLLGGTGRTEGQYKSSKTLSDYKAEVTQNNKSVIFQSQLAIWNEAANKEKKINKEILEDYRGFLSAKLELEKKYNEDRKRLIHAGATAEQFEILELNKDSALKALADEFASKEEGFKQFVDNLESLTLDKLTHLLQQAQQKLLELQMADKLGIKGNSQEYAKVQSLVNTLDKLKKSKTLSPEQKDKKNWTDLQSVITNLNNTFQDMGKEIGGIFGDIVGSIGEMTTASLSFMNGLKAMNEADGGLEKALAATSMVQAGMQVAMMAYSKITEAFGADYSGYNSMKEEYESLIEVWDSLIDKKLEYLSEGYGVEASRAGKEAINLLNKETEAWRKLGKERLNAGASAGSRSIGARQRNRMDDADLSLARSVVGSAIDGRMTGLFDLSVQQLEKLRETAPSFWAKMDGDVREYLESIIESEEKLKDIQDTISEKMTGITFDSMFDDFVSKLQDMESSWKDFADTSSEYFKNSIIEAMAQNFEPQLKSWYERWAVAAKDGITVAEQSSFIEEYNRITQDAYNQREQLKKMFGWTNNQGVSQSSASVGYSISASQDSVDAIGGRLTNILVNNETIAAKSTELSEKITMLNATAEHISKMQQDYTDIASECRDIAVDSYLELVEIRKNTSLLNSIRADISEIRTNTSRL